MTKLNRRQLLKSLSICAAGGAGGLAPLLAARRASAQSQEPRFLIVLAAAGGASIVDSFLAIRQSESANWETINTIADSEVKSIPDSPLRAVDLSRQDAGPVPFPFTANQSNFARKHRDNILVSTLTSTSVNHTVAQRRSITGNEAWKGRTLQEVVANEFGAGMPLPNVNMTGGGYIEHGTDRSLPSWAFNEPVADPTIWPLSLHGSRGQQDLPSADLIERARTLRDERLEPGSVFNRTFGKSSRLELWKRQRDSARQVLEGGDLISKLMFLPDIPQVPLSQYGLTESPDGFKVREKFPEFNSDPLEAQAALAFLLIKHRVSVTVTISPSFSVLLGDNFPPRIVNPPLAFDFSHNAHRAAQAIMWDRILGIADRLIDLLQAEPFGTSGESLWDRSMIYFATDFGRDRRRSGGNDGFGSGHHLNNGTVVVSPMVKGNSVLGGVDPDTGLTYGYDIATGAPDQGANMAERHIYAGILQSMGVDTAGSGLPDMRSWRK